MIGLDVLETLILFLSEIIENILEGYCFDERDGIERELSRLRGIGHRALSVIILVSK